MAGHAEVLSGRLALVADHLVLALREDPGAEQPEFVLSWYAVTWAAAAPAGNLAFVRSPLVPGGEAVLTDSPELDVALRPRLRPKAWPLADPELPAAIASFARGPVRDGRLETWIATEPVVIGASWRELGEPLVATGRVGGEPAWDSSTVLIEAAGWDATVNGSVVDGRPFPNDVWVPWFGRPLSTALVAFAEVFREVP